MEGEQQETQHNDTPGNVGGLIAEVESKMSELMAWHKSQVGQFEDEKSKFETEMNLQREALKAESEQQEQSFNEKTAQFEQDLVTQRKTLEDRIAEVEAQRVKLAGLANKLRAEESAMSREWGEVQKEREAVQQQAAEVAKLREQTQERAKAWLETTASELNEPLKLTTDTEDEHQEEHHHEHQGEHHHEAA